MWKSKFRCFIIGNRYVCTKDNDLAEVYSSVRKAVLHSDADDAFGRLLKDVIDGVEAFARHRRVSDSSLYEEVRRNFTLGYDTYSLSEEEFERVQNALVDYIYPLQALEESADQVSPLVDGKDESGGYDPKAKDREIRISAMHVTRDRSVAGSYAADYYADVDCSGPMEEREIRLDPLDGGCVRICSISEDAATLKWRDEECRVDFNSTAETKERLVRNPHLNSDSLKLVFSYRNLPSYAELWNMIANLGCDEMEEKEAEHLLFARKEEILHFIDKAIEKGNTGLYVAKALLSEYSNWGTCEISDIYSFQRELLEGIESGCLAPDNRFGWEWMEVATRYNDPADFMEDMDIYYEVLDTASSYGVVEAIDIMNSIWEPEQIIEED